MGRKRRATRPGNSPNPREQRAIRRHYSAASRLRKRLATPASDICSVVYLVEGVQVTRREWNRAAKRLGIEADRQAS